MYAQGEMGQSCTLVELCCKGKRCRGERKRKAWREMELQTADTENNTRRINAEVRTTSKHSKRKPALVCEILIVWLLIPSLSGKTKLLRAPSTAFPVLQPQKGLVNLIMVLHHHQQRCNYEKSKEESTDEIQKNKFQLFHWKKKIFRMVEIITTLSRSHV